MTTIAGSDRSRRRTDYADETGIWATFARGPEVAYCARAIPGGSRPFRSGPVQLVNRPHGTLLTAANQCSGHAGQTALAVRLPGWHALRSILRPTCTDVWASRCALTA